MNSRKRSSPVESICYRACFNRLRFEYNFSITWWSGKWENICANMLTGYLSEVVPVVQLQRYVLSWWRKYIVSYLHTSENLTRRAAWERWAWTGGYMRSRWNTPPGGRTGPEVCQRGCRKSPTAPILSILGSDLQQITFSYKTLEKSKNGYTRIIQHIF